MEGRSAYQNEEEGIAIRRALKKGTDRSVVALLRRSITTNCSFFRFTRPGRNAPTPARLLTAEIRLLIQRISNSNSTDRIYCMKKPIQFLLYFDLKQLSLKR